MGLSAAQTQVNNAQTQQRQALVLIHRYEKRGPCAGEKWDGDAYIMTDWAGRMASTSNRTKNSRDVPDLLFPNPAETGFGQICNFIKISWKKTTKQL